MKKGHVFTPIHRLNLAKSLRGKRKLKETKEKISRKMMGRKINESTKKKHRKNALLRSSWVKAIEIHMYKNHNSKVRFNRRKIYPNTCHICGKVIGDWNDRIARIKTNQ